MEENKLRVVFDPEFVEKISELGNSVTISDYNIEDLRVDITDINEILSDDFPVYRYDSNKILPVSGLWDLDSKSFKTHISLPEGVFSNKVKEPVDGEDPEMFEIESKDSNDNNDGDGLVRIIRFNYYPNPTIRKTAFVLTGEVRDGTGKLIIDPIKCDQDRILITIFFPNTTKANIEASKIEKDTEFLEGFGIQGGVNVFRTNTSDTLGTRDSSYKYLNCVSGKIDIEKKDIPYIGDDGRNIYRRDTIRIYTGIKIYCSNLQSNIRPKTRASLDKNGGIIKIYGTLKYDEYEIFGTEYIHIGEGVESIDGIPDSKLVLTTHEGGLLDANIENKFYISYGRYDGQQDPSVLVKAVVKFWNPFTRSVETVESENIKLTQEENIIPEWEIIYRSTDYSEPTYYGDIPVYLFPWQAGFSHSFTIRTTIPNINIEEDFYIEYEDPILKDYFDLTIEKDTNRVYPITDYIITIKSKTDNLDTLNWLPIINEISEIKLSTLWLKDYGYYESFYFVQSPNVCPLEIHDYNNQNISEVVFEYNQESFDCFPVAIESDTENISERNAWEIIESSPSVSFNASSGDLNPNNIDYLENKLTIYSYENPETIGDLNLGSMVLGRIKKSEAGNNFLDTKEWRNIVSLYKLNIPIKKKGIIENIDSDSSIVLDEIELYEVKVISNGPFACWMNKSEDYCFFNPKTNKPTYTNYFYSEDFDSTDGIYIYVSLYNSTILNEDLELDGLISFTVTENEPDWGDTIPDCFNNPENLSTCEVYRKAPQEVEIDYVDSKDCYVFLGAYEETSIRFRSTETPVVDRLQNINSYNIIQQFDSYNPYSYNEIQLLDSPTPIYTTEEFYKYHIQHIQNPNELSDYYPISPCCLYNVHSYNYPSISKSFYLFRKALGPSFYRTDDSRGNVIYMTYDSGGDDTSRTLIIRSRYRIPNDEFIIDYNIYNSFVIESITQTILNTGDYKYQYNVVLNTIVSNTGGQRLLGSITITSRIYNLINQTSHTSIEIPYVELTQEDIDSIVVPAKMEISIIQEAGSDINTGEIEVSGDRTVQISNSGETRLFTIYSQIPIQYPDVTDELNCNVYNISTSGFTFTVDSIVSGYEPVVPSDTDEYTLYTNSRNIGFNLSIYPAQEVIEDYSPYREAFSFKQSGISRGLIYASKNNTPKLYLGTSNIVENVNSDTTSINIFLGSFDIKRQVLEGSIGTLRDVNIRSSDNYYIVSNSSTYLNTGWTNNVVLEFPENTTSRPISRVFTITCNDKGFLHQLKVTVIQSSSFGNIICNDNAYFLSNGECIEDTNDDNLGYFSFDTNIPISLLSLGIPKDVLESYGRFIYVGPSSFGGSYKKYKVYIKLRPNLSNSTKNQIFNFIKNGNEVIRSVYINQGYYCLTLCQPNLTTDVGGIYSGGTLGSEQDPISVPSRSNLRRGDRKVFKLILSECEPDPTTGEFTTISVDLFDRQNTPIITNYTWTLLSTYDPSPRVSSIDNRNTVVSRIDDDSNRPIINIGGEIGNNNIPDSSSKYLSSYGELISLTDLIINQRLLPFLENNYTVKSEYYNFRLDFRIDINILTHYPTNSPLYTFGRTVEHQYTIYISKQSEGLLPPLS